MGETPANKNRRILIVDDNDAIHRDFQQILNPVGDMSPLRDMEAALFDEPTWGKIESPRYELDSAYQGQEALEKVLQAVGRDQPYALAFVDVRMPPGWDGVETVYHLWRANPALQIVICSAYSDYKWDEMAGRLGFTDRLVILKKPFEPIEVKQLACALTEKWNLVVESERNLKALHEKQVELERLYKQAEEASRLKDEFLAIVSHELRNPLHVILGNASILSRHTLSLQQIHKSAEAIFRNAQAQAHIINDLLDISRIVKGNMRLQIVSSDVTEMVVSAVETLSSAAAAKSIQFDLQIPPALPRVWLDPHRGRQIVTNLVSNAIKFTPCGGRVEVLLEIAQGLLRIVVRDNGEGITQSFIPYLFDRFRQADSSATRRHGGLGLGLSIVRHLVELHGGRVRAESAGKGQGATFTVELPVVTQSPLAGSTSAPKDRARGGLAPKGREGGGINGRAPSPISPSH